MVTQETLRIGEDFKRRRVEANVTQLALCEHSRVAPQTLINFEAGRTRNPDQNTIDKLENSLKVLSADEVLLKRLKKESLEKKNVYKRAPHQISSVMPGTNKVYVRALVEYVVQGEVDVEFTEEIISTQPLTFQRVVTNVLMDTLKVKGNSLNKNNFKFLEIRKEVPHEVYPHYTK